MKMLRHLGLAAACTAMSSVLAQGAPAGPAPTPEQLAAANFNRFVQWFGGEWNNHEQVWQQRIDAAKLPGGKPEDPIYHTHHVFAPVSMPKLGEHIFYVQQSLDGDMSKSYRQRVYRLTPQPGNVVKLEIFAFADDKAVFNAHLKPEVLNNIEPASLRATPGCDVFWKWDATARAYDGSMPKDACKINSPRLGKTIVINDTLKLTESEIWINDQARDEQGNHVFGSKTNTPTKNRKVNYFAGWAFGTEPGTGKKLKGERALMMHNEGQRITLNYEDGTPSPYRIELAQLTYQNTRVPILKLALLDSSEAKRGAYTWASTDSSRVGLNLGWVQFGFTRKTSAQHFGYTPQFSSHPNSSGLNELANHLMGYFSSADQNKADSYFFNIELRVVRAWPERSDGTWLYVEQADAKTPERPYRQRVYRLEQRGDQYLSHIYEFKGDPLVHAGQWKQAQPLRAISPADLVLKEGCEVIMTRTANGGYQGATRDKACPSVLRGSRYASAKVSLDAKLLESWDQGFDADGKQVWGSIKGAYKFVKITPQP